MLFNLTYSCQSFCETCCFQLHCKVPSTLKMVAEGGIETLIAIKQLETLIAIKQLYSATSQNIIVSIFIVM
jgi:hypothetical protein